MTLGCMSNQKASCHLREFNKATFPNRARNLTVGFEELTRSPPSSGLRPRMNITSVEFDDAPEDEKNQQRSPPLQAWSPSRAAGRLLGCLRCNRPSRIVLTFAICRAQFQRVEKGAVDRLHSAMSHNAVAAKSTPIVRLKMRRREPMLSQSRRAEPTHAQVIRLPIAAIENTVTMIAMLANRAWFVTNDPAVAAASIHAFGFAY
jgi:hypothetical protein